MFKRISFVLALVAGVFLASCDQKQQLQKLAESTLQQTIDDPSHLKVIGISEPDSAFGGKWNDHFNESGFRQHHAKDQ